MRRGLQQLGVQGDKEASWGTRLPRRGQKWRVLESSLTMVGVETIEIY